MTDWLISLVTWNTAAAHGSLSQHSEIIHLKNLPKAVQNLGLHCTLYMSQVCTFSEWATLAFWNYLKHYDIDFRPLMTALLNSETVLTQATPRLYSLPKDIGRVVQGPLLSIDERWKDDPIEALNLKYKRTHRLSRRRRWGSVRCTEVEGERRASFSD